MRLLRFKSSFTFNIRYNYSLHAHRIAILDSVSHSKGLMKIQRSLVDQQSKFLNSEFEVKAKRIERLRKSIRQSGIQLQNSSHYKSFKKDQKVEQYLQQYSELLDLLKDVNLKKQWLCKVIGWYNVISYYHSLINCLLLSTQKQLYYLIYSLSLMKYQWTNHGGLIDPQLRQNRKIDNFYQNLPRNIQLSTLKSIQKIIVAPIAYSKRVYFENYALKYIENIQKNEKISQKQINQQLIWLFERCIQNMIDNHKIISFLQKCLLKQKLLLNKESLQLLMNAYSLQGQINHQIYLQYLRPFLYETKMNSIPGIIQGIKFIILSEVVDNLALKTLFQLLQTYYRPQLLTRSELRYDLHFCLHYLHVKGYKINLSNSLNQQLIDFCRQQSSGRSNINKIALKQIKSDGKLKYISSCLYNNQSVFKSQSTQYTQYQNHFISNVYNKMDLKDIKIYKKPKFCGFQLDFCFINKSSKIFAVQIQGLQYSFTSGKSIRRRQMRNEILQYYGIKVINIGYKSNESKSRVQYIDLLTKLLKDN